MATYILDLGQGTSAYITPVYAYISVLYKDSIE